MSFLIGGAYIMKVDQWGISQMVMKKVQSFSGSDILLDMIYWQYYTRRPSSPSQFSYSVDLSQSLDFFYALEGYWNGDKYGLLATGASRLFYVKGVP